VTIKGMPVSVYSNGEVTVGAETLARQNSNSGLGSLMVGGLQTSGPPVNSVLTRAQHSSTPTPDSSSSSEHISKGKAGSMKGILAWMTVAIVATSTSVLA